jgi:chaperonin cofactor prefoldin
MYAVMTSGLGEDAAGYDRSLADPQHMPRGQELQALAAHIGDVLLRRLDTFGRLLAADLSTLAREEVREQVETFRLTVETWRRDLSDAAASLRQRVQELGRLIIEAGRVSSEQLIVAVERLGPLQQQLSSESARSAFQHQVTEQVVALAASGFRDNVVYRRLPPHVRQHADELLATAVDVATATALVQPLIDALGQLHIDVNKVIQACQQLEDDTQMAQALREYFVSSSQN